uniref:Uncharacterized protein n=1 Tax=Anguilla anguilla TaxID=7936 RepID=A0A0E9XYT6_ANGAN
MRNIPAKLAYSVLNHSNYTFCGGVLEPLPLYIGREAGIHPEQTANLSQYFRPIMQNCFLLKLI